MQPQLNFEIFAMDEQQNPFFQTPTNWTQISRVLLSRSKFDSDLPKLQRSRKEIHRHKKCQTLAMNYFQISRTLLRRKSAEGDIFGHINQKVQTIDSKYPRTIINQNLITQIRALRILRQTPKIVVKKPIQKQVIQKKNQLKNKRHKSACKLFRVPLSRMFRVKSLPLKLEETNQTILKQIKFDDPQILPLEHKLVQKINVLLQTNRRLSLRNILKQKTEIICTAKFWNKIGKRRKSSYLLKSPQQKLEPIPLQKSISNNSSQGFKTPNLIQNSLFSNLYKLQDIKKQYLENLNENEQEFQEESNKHHEPKHFATGRDFVKLNKQMPQLQKILGFHQELRKYMGNKSPTINTLQNSLCGKKQTVDQMLKKHLKQQQSLGTIKTDDRKLLTKTSSYTESSSQIKSLIMRQKKRKVFVIK